MKPLHVGERMPWTIAHRGASAEFPENTAAAFEAALRSPIDGIELDLQLSRDEVPVVYHDRTLAKVGAGRRRVSGLDLARIRALDAGGWFDRRFCGERIPTLDEVLDRFGRRTRLLLEIKARDERGGVERHRKLTENTVAAVRARGLEGRVLLLCFDPRVLEIARDLAPRLPTVLNLRALPRGAAALRETLDPLFAVSVDARALTVRFVREAHERGKPVLTYTCNTTRGVLAALGTGVDAMMSDRPGWLAGLVSERERAEPAAARRTP